MVPAGDPNDLSHPAYRRPGRNPERIPPHRSHRRPVWARLDRWHGRSAVTFSAGFPAATTDFRFWRRDNSSAAARLHLKSSRRGLRPRREMTARRELPSSKPHFSRARTPPGILMRNRHRTRSVRGIASTDRLRRPRSRLKTATRKIVVASSSSVFFLYLGYAIISSHPPARSMGRGAENAVRHGC
jgi:hypothetical protein